MRRLRLAVIGFGRVGKACAAIVDESHDLALAGIVRRPESRGRPLPERFRNIPVGSQSAQISDLHGAIICVSTMAAVAADQACLQQGVPGAPRRLGHQQFLLEARFDESVLTAQVMIAAARALLRLKPGAYSLLDVPVSAMWGAGSEKAEREWL